MAMRCIGAHDGGIIRASPRASSTLLKRQAGKCRHCGGYFKAGDVLEVDHIIPRAAGGRDAYTNWQLLHRYCHVAKTARERRRCA